MRQPDWQTEDGTIRLYHGDCLDILPELEAGSVDAVVTDPPYSSGGQFRGDRARSVVQKYVQSGAFTQETRSEFSGDTMDQRSFTVWAKWWLSACRDVCTPGACLSCFIDWRQIPTLTDCVQMSGWIWRNVCTWWKPGCRMQRGRFSSSAEFLIYATNGPHESDGECSPQNVISCATLTGDEKEHIAEKPSEVVEWAMSVVRPGGVVLDPFFGSCSGGVAALRTGRKFIGIELDRHSFDLGVKRITDELGKLRLFEKPPKIVQRNLLDEDAA